MPDLTIGPDEVKAALDNLFQNFKPSTTQQEVGRVIEAGDGIARVVGLPNVVANEMLEFPGDLIGIALNLEPEQLGVVILGDANAIEEGMPVTQTHNVLSIPVGDAYLGRAVDALGNPIDGKGPLDK
ncbi:MAG: F0F1 ATP synthase subunit alpha, partial [Actinomycetota bacterium]